MSQQISSLIVSRPRGSGAFSVRSFKLEELGPQASPLFVVDDFRVRAHVFGPHPHAGFSAVTYVFEDSVGSLRSRDSLGNDVVVGPGGIVWTQAGRGALHEEMPAQPGRELHGLQFFVNLSAHNKMIEPRVLWLQPSEVPEWRSPAGDRVRVVVGAYEDVSSPLVPAEPFTLLDVELRDQLFFDLPAGCNALVYTIGGTVRMLAGGHDREVRIKHMLALSGEGRVAFAAREAARFLILSGLDLREPAIGNGPFLMSDRGQLNDAIERYQRGEMGNLEPLNV